MARRIAFFLAVITAAITLLAASELPTSDADESFEVEPPILIPNRDSEGDSVTAAITPAPMGDPERLEKEVERAIRRAQAAERLFKMGAFAKAEVEQRALRVVQLQSDLEKARLERTKQEIAQQEAQVVAGEISKADLGETELQLAHAIKMAHDAAAKRERAEVEAAEINLRRQKLLLAVGLGRQSEVSRDVQKLSELKAAKD
ncbi:MAG: hypothetical protein JWO45_135 [Spartobacteria bacterium]|nr:hypothetical protein [Spartobacteria bacterium]